jgi:hypothetical protein
MKNIISVAILAATVSFSLQGTASTLKSDTTKVGKVTRKVGNQVSNTAANTASHVVDKKYDGKYGPNGETVYINKYSHYYYVNKKGHRVYLKKSELMDAKVK